MLNRNTLVTAIPLTERLEDAKVALYPVSGTPLEAMVNATRSDEGLFDAAKGNVDVFISHIETMANKVQPAYGVSHHNATLDQIASMGIAAVQRHLNVARTVVRPVINDLFTRVKASLAEFNASALLGMEVDVLREPAPLENAQLQNAVRKFDRLTIEDLPLRMKLPDLSPGELTELISTGSGQLDTAIAEWLSHDPDLLSFVWANVFQSKPMDVSRSFLSLITDRVYGVNNALAIYLISRRLMDGKPLEGTEMSLSAYEQQIVDLRNQSGAALSRALERIQRSMKNGILVREIIGSKTVVYEPLYRKFLEDGGSNEILFANALGGQGFHTSMKDLLENKSKLAERWNFHAAAVRTEESNQRFVKTKDLIRLHFYSQLAELGGTEEGTEGNIASVKSLFDVVMRDVRDSDLDNLHDLCMKVVCRARFYKTDAEVILAGISQAMKENPQLTPREAASLSAINYVATWGARMMKLVSI